MRGETRSGSCLVTLVRTQTVVTSHLARRLRRHALSPAAFQAMLLLGTSGRELSPHEIGEELGVTRGAVTLLLDSLERRGLVSRRQHPDDRRMQLVRLTPAGDRLLAALGEEHDSGERQLLACLDARERQTLMSLLERLRAHVTTLGAD